MKTKDFYIYVFDTIEQNVSEPFDSFVYRLQHAAEKCEFLDENGEIKRRVIARCRFDSLRRVAFNKCLDFEELLRIGRNSELEEKNFNSDGSRLSQSSSSAHSQHWPKDDFCTRCGSNDHLFWHKKCPAIKHLCTVCHVTGHLEKFCFKIMQPRNRLKRRAEPEQETPNSAKMPQFAVPPETSQSVTKTEKFESEETLEVSSIEVADSTMFSPAKTEPQEILFEFVENNEISSTQVSSAVRNEEPTKCSSKDGDGTVKKIPKDQPKRRECIMGGIKQIVVIRDQHDRSHNVVTKALHRKLRDLPFKSCSRISEELEIDGNQYCGSFEADLESGKLKVRKVRFYVTNEQAKEEATIDRKYAKILNLC